jgi:hypothetical protein
MNNSHFRSFGRKERVPHQDGAKPGPFSFIHATIRVEVDRVSDTISPQPAPRTAAEYRTVINELLTEMEHINEQMRRDQAEIDRLAAETAVIKEETRALLAAMGAAV